MEERDRLVDKLADVEARGLAERQRLHLELHAAGEALEEAREDAADIAFALHAIGVPDGVGLVEYLAALRRAVGVVRVEADQDGKPVVYLRELVDREIERLRAELHRAANARGALAATYAIRLAREVRDPVLRRAAIVDLESELGARIIEGAAREALLGREP